MAIFVHIRVMSDPQLEGIAYELLEEMQMAAPVCAFRLADKYGIVLTPVGQHEESFDGRECRFFARNHRAGQATVMRAVATKRLDERGYDASVARNVEALARMLALPRARFDADVRTSRGMAYLRKRHPHVSDSAIGARMADVGALSRSQRTRSGRFPVVFVEGTSDAVALLDVTELPVARFTASRKR